MFIYWIAMKSCHIIKKWHGKIYKKRNLTKIPLCLSTQISRQEAHFFKTENIKKWCSNCLTFGIMSIGLGGRTGLGSVAVGVTALCVGRVRSGGVWGRRCGGSASWGRHIRHRYPFSAHLLRGNSFINLFICEKRMSFASSNKKWSSFFTQQATI